MKVLTPKRTMFLTANDSMETELRSLGSRKGETQKHGHVLVTSTCAAGCAKYARKIQDQELISSQVQVADILVFST